MEFDVEIWLQDLTAKLFEEFDNRIKFLGLQGSYRRGEANVNSNVDVVVILDKVSYRDLFEYKSIINSMHFYEKASGFVVGQDELLKWPKYDLFQLINDTVPLHGSLKDLLPKITTEDVKYSVKVNSAKLYNDLSYGYLFHNDDLDVLHRAYKKAFFIMQTLHFLRKGEYLSTKKELELELETEEKEILLINMKWNSLNVEDNYDFYFEKLLNWVKSHI